MHSSKQNMQVEMRRVDVEDIGDPEIIAFYNPIKGGVDGLDEKCIKRIFH